MGSPEEIMPGVFDWSVVHEPSSNRLFEPLERNGRADWGRFKLPEEQVARFWRDGYITNVPILTPEQCDLVLQDAQYLLDSTKRHPAHDLLYEYHSNQSGDPDNVLVHCLGHWRLTQLFHDIIFHPKVVVPCSQLLSEGREVSVRYWHDQFFAKPAKHGGVVAWHQDYSYWTRTKPMMHMTVHVALDDQTPDNGGLMYVPGSHRWTREGNPLPVLDFNFKDMEGIKTILTEEELKGFKPQHAMLKKGEASFHHPLMVHGSFGNRSDAPRRATVLNYFGDGVSSNSDEPFLQQHTHDGRQLPQPIVDSLRDSNIKKGLKMEGRFYPLVYDPSWSTHS